MSRGDTMDYTGKLVVEECCSCHMVFAISTDFQQRALADHSLQFYCPQGHPQHYTGPSTQQHLERERAKNIALADQLHAAEAEAEARRVDLIKQRYRFSRGVCPCCDRSFPALARHMLTQHPDYDPGDLSVPVPKFKCSCGRSFGTPNGLRIHQSRMRSGNWTNPTVPKWARHLTVGDRP